MILPVFLSSGENTVLLGSSGENTFLLGSSGENTFLLGSTCGGTPVMVEFRALLVRYSKFISLLLRVLQSLRKEWHVFFGLNKVQKMKLLSDNGR